MTAISRAELQKDPLRRRLISKLYPPATVTKQPVCGMRHDETGFICTRPMSHTGTHVAHLHFTNNSIHTDVCDLWEEPS